MVNFENILNEITKTEKELDSTQSKYRKRDLTRRLKYLRREYRTAKMYYKQAVNNYGK